MITAASGYSSGSRLAAYDPPGPWIAAALVSYFAGMTLFRWELGLSGAASRVAGAILALLIWPVWSDGAAITPAHAAAPVSGRSFSAILPLILALFLAIAMLITDRMQLGNNKQAAP